jgi:hypothetical protein
MRMIASINHERELKKRKFVSSCFRQTEYNVRPGYIAALREAGIAGWNRSEPCIRYPRRIMDTHDASRFNRLEA